MKMREHRSEEATKSRLPQQAAVHARKHASERKDHMNIKMNRNMGRVLLAGACAAALAV